jgi:Tol biopolymer transport system component
MSDTKELLDRARARFTPPEGVMDELIRRRARKQRNHRIAAGAVGMALFAALVIAGAALGSNVTRPANHTPSPSPSIDEGALPQILHHGEVLWTMWRDEYVGQGDASGVVQEVVPSGRANRDLFGCDGHKACPSVLDHGQAFLSGDGRWAAAASVTCNSAGVVCSTNELWVADALGDVIRVTHPCTDWLPDDCHPQTWAWSPVGDTLAVWEGTEPQRLYLFDPATGKRTMLAHPVGNGIEGLTWSTDGSLITYAVEGPTPADAKIYTVPATGGTPRLIARGLDPVWSPDDATLSFLVPHDGIFVVDADGSGRSLIGRGGVEATWSPDGSRIAYRVEQASPRGRLREQLWIVSTDGSNRVEVLDGLWARIERGSITWSPDGTRIAFQGNLRRPNWPPPYGDAWYVLKADGSSSVVPIHGLEDRRTVASWRT